MSDLDLVWLVADKNMEATVRGLLKRPAALAIRPIDCETLVHPRRDPGCFHEASAMLAGYRDRARHALVLLDRAWEGAPEASAAALESQLEATLARDLGAGWASAIVIDPELEAWVFAQSPHVDEALGWTGRQPKLREVLVQRNLWAPQAAKPSDPKKAVEHALRAVRKPRSSSIYRQLAERVTLQGCQDRAFQRLTMLLKEWFGQQPGDPP
ncbi:MAG: hypothetical protein AMXMBFR72_31680 [Betaproteobacteria bacterium]